MAMMLANWIGPILEAEIKAAMESKMAHVYSGSSITVTSSPYYAEYQLDRSSLRASLRFSDDQTEQVQVLEDRNHIRKDTWMVTDGSTAMRILLTQRAVEKFRGAPEPESMSKIKKGVMLQLSKFSVIVPLSKDNPKIQVEVHDFRVTVSVPQPTMGNPRDIDIRSGIQSLVKQILQLRDSMEFSSSMRERSALPSNAPEQLSDLSSVPQLTSQSLLPQGKVSKGGVNLDRPTGIERYEEKSLAKNSAVQGTVMLDSSIRSEIPGAGPRHHRTKVSAANSVSGASPPSPGSSDEDMLSEDDAASKSSQDPTPTANIAHFDKPIEKAHANQTEPLPVPKRMDISDWNNLPQLTRSMTMVPRNQAKLLTSPESWFPAAPGKKFPTPNLPIDIIKQIHSKTPAPAPANLLDPSSPPSEDNEDSSGAESASGSASGEPRQEGEGDNDEEGLAIDWTPTPRPARFKVPPELPPDSSALSIRGMRLEGPQSSPLTSSLFRKVPASGVPSSSEQSSTRESDVEMEEEAPKPLDLRVKETPATPNLGIGGRSTVIDMAMGTTVVPCTSAPPSTPTARTGPNRLTKRELLTDPKDRPPPKRAKSLNTVSYGFSQEDPVSQDPAPQALQERRSFLSNKSRSPVDLSIEDNQAGQKHHNIVAERILLQFRSNYPEHKCDLRMFLGLCKMIDRLQREGRMQHKLLWDDFIIRYNVEYRAYTLRAIEGCEDALPYFLFYQNHIEEPKYMKQIMTPQKLQEILSAEAVPVVEEE